MKWQYLKFKGLTKEEIEGRELKALNLGHRCWIKRNENQGEKWDSRFWRCKVAASRYAEHLTKVGA